MSKEISLEKVEILIEEKREKFKEFKELLLEYNNKFNLTSITEEKEIYYKHFLDSCVGESLIQKGSQIIEIGSGAGFPSIPLKIIREDLFFTLAESTGKKCEFLKLCANKLGMEGIKVVNERAEVLAKDKRQREKYDVVCARAVAPMNTLAEYCMPFIKLKGIFIAYKGNNEKEIREAEGAIKKLGGRIRDEIHYELPLEYGQRTLIVVEKLEKTPEKYPRGNGQERKKPLK